jgi:putative salt-induced outer membrane protein
LIAVLMLSCLPPAGLLAAPAEARPARRVRAPRPPSPPPPPLELNLPAPEPLPVRIVLPEWPRLPEGIRAMIDTAIASDDPGTVATVVGIAKRTAPAFEKEIEAIAGTFRRRLAAAAAAKQEAERTRKRNPDIFALWSGQMEVGGSWSTGNTEAIGLYGSAKLKREGLDWRHEVNAQVNYQETGGNTTTERWLLGYTPRYSFDGRYAYGLAQYEHDRFLGYATRMTAGGGFGFKAVSTRKLSVELDLGPALRYTEYYDDPTTLRLAGRGSVNAKWAPLEKFTLSQQAAFYLQDGGTTVSSTTALDTLLFGPLKGRLSYNVQYESNSPSRLHTTDTISRASLLYSF